MPSKQEIERIVKEFKHFIGADEVNTEWLRTTLTSLTEAHKVEMEKMVDAIWNDKDLQDDIQRYGEWNNEKLQEAFNKAKTKHIAGKFNIEVK